MSAVSQRIGGPQQPVRARLAGRLDLFFIVFAVILFVLALRLVHLQVLLRPHYMWLSKRIEHGPRVEAPRRGGLYARDLSPLAESVERLSLCADPCGLAGKHNEPDLTAAAAEGIAEAFGLDRDRVLAHLKAEAERGKSFTYVQRLLTEEQAARADALDSGRPWTAHVWTKSEWQREYPMGEFACHVVGRCSSYHEPLEGIESRWDFLLRGTPGSPRHDLDAFGRRILGQDTRGVRGARDGLNLILTIDPEIQEAAEAAVERCMRDNRPRGATCVVLDADTSEILASASRPGYDPRHIPECSPDEMKARLCNSTVSRAYEPGSVLKVLLVAALLETGSCPPDTTFYCGGVMQLSGEPLRCWGRWQHNGGHHSCDMTRMLAQSCNVAAAQFALTLKRRELYQFLRGCGIGVQTRTGMPAEARGYLRPPAEASDRDQASLGFGQGVLVNDIQVANAIAAVVNGGRLMQPHIVRAVTDPQDNEIVREIEPVQLGVACSPETSAAVRRMMGAVVTQGTGAPAFISDEVQVGGKTGTAQKWDARTGRYVVGKNIVSFVLVAPLDHPKFVVLFTADEPGSGAHGSDVAAPRAREVAMAALRDAGLLSVETEIEVAGGS